MKKEEVCSRRGINLAVMIYDITKNPTHNSSKNDSAVAEETEGEREREREKEKRDASEVSFPPFPFAKFAKLPPSFPGDPYTFLSSPFSRASVRPSCRPSHA